MISIRRVKDLEAGDRCATQITVLICLSDASSGLNRVVFIRHGVDFLHL